MLFCEEIDKKVQGSVLTHRSLFMKWPLMRPYKPFKRKMPGSPKTRAIKWISPKSQMLSKPPARSSMISSICSVPIDNRMVFL